MLFFLLGKIVYSADANGDPLVEDISMPDLPPGDYGIAFVKMFLTLIALIALLGGSAWFLRRLVRGRLQRTAVEPLIQVLEKRMISPKSILYLIEVEGQKVLVAESQHEIRRLESWPQRAELLSTENSADTTDGSFKIP